ncbi:hypothetical protein COOONC_00546 [Cooperia oncophora]
MERLPLCDSASIKLAYTKNTPCGTVANSFEISEILKFTYTASGTINKWLRGETHVGAETQWPDLWHIGDVFLQWYKSLMLAMEHRYEDNDFGCLSNYLGSNNQTASGFENDLTLTLEALHQQVDLAAVLQVDWNHCKGDEHYVLGGAGEQVLRILRLLRTAEQTAEKIAKLVTRYTLLDRLFEEQVVIGRLNSIHRHAWLDRKHRFEVDSRKVLDWAQLRSALLRRLIEELEKELRKTENRCAVIKWRLVSASKMEAFKFVFTILAPHRELGVTH